MTYAVVENSAGQKFIVSNTVENSAGTEFVVDNYVDDSDGNPFLIFTDNVSVIPRMEFVVTANRLFAATGDLSAQ